MLSSLGAQVFVLVIAFARFNRSLREEEAWTVVST